MKWNDSIEAEYQDTTTDDFMTFFLPSRFTQCEFAMLPAIFPVLLFLSSFFLSLHHRLLWPSEWKCMQNRYSVRCTLILLSEAAIASLLFSSSLKPFQLCDCVQWWWKENCRCQCVGGVWCTNWVADYFFSFLWKIAVHCNQGKVQNEIGKLISMEVTTSSSSSLSLEGGNCKFEILKKLNSETWLLFALTCGVLTAFSCSFYASIPSRLRTLFFLLKSCCCYWKMILFLFLSSPHSRWKIAIDMRRDVRGQQQKKNINKVKRVENAFLN